ncbi:sensor histidine kinase [Staphylococcus gallinarum]|uniref:sensor histidine kinase n=5 Tax=Staphylococcus gallinarum TaxID=1293 RepID=UPI000E69EADD|nr:HAMP domain-containing sensor histidine kinase [Staphylococcus gallinarum]MBU7217155.1 HAMP domain-containing histidine kinase [Staphylococcus gallinarum]RIL26586.1 sensor histidine kinase [Staphylococcus gallinarum]RIO81426.1 sensor histidine kinase [Staphylococcus gallinarum]RIO98171.1 sensor histidine kinase [Staphylococcus gallinarum]
MSLKQKYFRIMIIGIISVPIIFIIVNYMTLAIILFLEYFLKVKINVPFSSTILTFIIYTLFFMFLFGLVLLGSRYIKQITQRIKNMEKTVEWIANESNLPEKLIIKSHKKDEIDELGLSINILIDRLRYKEIELQERINNEQNNINQISHDINTPLTALRLELFQLSKQYCIENEDIEVSYERIDYISSLIKSISIDRIDNIEYYYTFNNKVNMNEISNRVLEKWRYLLNKKAIAIHFETIDKEVIWLGEKLWYERLFENIISNIYEHSNANSIKIIIMNKMISVEDDGIGFNIIEHKNSKGLSIIHNIAERFSLELSITSNNGGTKFTLFNHQV